MLTLYVPATQASPGQARQVQFRCCLGTHFAFQAQVQYLDILLRTCLYLPKINTLLQVLTYLGSLTCLPIASHTPTTLNSPAPDILTLPPAHTHTHTLRHLHTHKTTGIGADVVLPQLPSSYRLSPMLSLIYNLRPMTTLQPELPKHWMSPPCFETLQPFRDHTLFTGGA